MKKVKPSHLECTVCKSRNYKLKRAAMSTDRLELSKYCKHCRAHTPHREAR